MSKSIEELTEESREAILADLMGFGRACTPWEYIARTEITSLRSQLEEARRKAIEQCIAIVGSMREGFRSPEYATGQPDSSINERIACTMIVNNLRALLSAPTEERGRG